MDLGERREPPGSNGAHLVACSAPEPASNIERDQAKAA
jgi:hypothetical protein